MQPPTILLHRDPAPPFLPVTTLPFSPHRDTSPSLSSLSSELSHGHATTGEPDPTCVGQRRYVEIYHHDFALYSMRFQVTKLVMGGRSG
ncbi:hypothetical protein L484_016645 [Morus notabilis]|uniref:Uncharacterized protein n=1 Tax=Morus notabilis TaxID=981085 RepID=W9RXE0_9ROSA|nr:hypothetical protein L484_016645 [Morus notabilis]